MSTAIELHVDAISCSGRDELRGGRGVEEGVEEGAEMLEKGVESQSRE